MTGLSTLFPRVEPYTLTIPDVVHPHKDCPTHVPQMPCSQVQGLTPLARWGSSHARTTPPACPCGTAALTGPASVPGSPPPPLAPFVSHLGVRVAGEGLCELLDRGRQLVALFLGPHQAQAARRDMEPTTCRLLSFLPPCGRVALPLSAEGQGGEICVSGKHRGIKQPRQAFQANYCTFSATVSSTGCPTLPLSRSQFLLKQLSEEGPFFSIPWLCNLSKWREAHEGR